MEKEFTIDWLQYTIPPESSHIKHWIGHGERQRSFVPMYRYMELYKNGVTLHYGNPNSSRVLCVITGKVCRAIGVDNGFCARIVNAQAHVSRIDLAMTTDKNILPLIQLDHEKIESHMYSEMKIISDADYTPETIYCGDMSKRSSKGIVRAYNKGLQLGLEGIDMFRIEVENKRKHAEITTKRLASGDTIASCMNAKFRINSAWYQEIFGDSISTERFPSENENQLSDIERKMIWIEKQVLPSLQYVIEYDKQNGTQNFAKLLDMLRFD